MSLLLLANLANKSVSPYVGRKGDDCDGSITSEGYNLIEFITGCSVTGDTTGNIIGVDPMLGPLADNGGPTLTMEPLPGSPAIDAGSCSDQTRDQRGLPRPVDDPGAPNVDDGCDVGAVEKQ